MAEAGVHRVSITLVVFFFCTAILTLFTTYLIVLYTCINGLACIEEDKQHPSLRLPTGIPNKYIESIDHELVTRLYIKM